MYIHLQTAHVKECIFIYAYTCKRKYACMRCTFRNCPHHCHLLVHKSFFFFSLSLCTCASTYGYVCICRSSMYACVHCMHVCKVLACARIAGLLCTYVLTYLCPGTRHKSPYTCRYTYPNIQNALHLSMLIITSCTKVCMRMCIHIHVYKCEYVYICTYTCIYIQTYTQLSPRHAHTHTHTHTFIRLLSDACDKIPLQTGP